jgi:hypothetical protein
MYLLQPCLRLVSLPLWLSVSPTRVALEVADGSPAAALRGAWERTQKAQATLMSAVSEHPAFAPLLDAHKSAAASTATGAGAPPLLPAGFFESLASTTTVDSATPAAQQPFALLQRLVDASFIPSLLRQFIRVLQKV